MTRRHARPQSCETLRLDAHEGLDAVSLGLAYLHVVNSLTWDMSTEPYQFWTAVGVEYQRLEGEASHAEAHR